MNCEIIVVDSADKKVQEELAATLEPIDQKEFDAFELFWKEWFENIIPGEKITVLAKYKQKPIGVVRLWKSPLCGDKWLVEGLYVISEKRHEGIGEAMVRLILHRAKQQNIKDVFVHIRDNNSPSRKLFNKLGFKLSQKSKHLDSFGDLIINGSEYKRVLQ